MEINKIAIADMNNVPVDRELERAAILAEYIDGEVDAWVSTGEVDAEEVELALADLREQATADALASGQTVASLDDALAVAAARGHRESHVARAYAEAYVAAIRGYADGAAARRGAPQDDAWGDELPGREPPEGWPGESALAALYEGGTPPRGQRGVAEVYAEAYASGWAEAHDALLEAAE
jgi:hypothetical protein